MRAKGFTDKEERGRVVAFVCGEARADGVGERAGGAGRGGGRFA